jgi:hypothetical protein
MPIEWTSGKIPRFHPLIKEHNSVVAWWVCDGQAKREHSLAVPYIEEPCDDRNEALILCGILNEENNA